MKKALFTLILVTFALTSFAQRDTIALAKQLIQKKKYESAMMLLNRADSTNDRPDYVIAKTDLVLNYFVTSIMHQFFALKDLKPNEDVADYRGQNGSFSLFAFAPDSLLNRLKAKYPNNYQICKALGDFYREVDLKYDNRWLTDSVLDYMYDNYKTAYEHGVYDANSLHHMGMYLLMNNDFETCIPYFEQSLGLDAKNADGHYNVAIAYIYTGKSDLAIPHAKKSLQLYKNLRFKADAAKMLGNIYLGKKDCATALKYAEQAYKILPTDFSTLLNILDAQLGLNDKKYLSTTEGIFDIEPAHPIICQRLAESYVYAEKPQTLIDFFQQKINESSLDATSIGILYFYIGELLSGMKENAKAKEFYQKANEQLQKSESDNREEYLDEIRLSIEEYLK